MTANQTLAQLHKLINILIENGLSDYQNLPSTSGLVKRDFEISVSTASNLSVALRDRPYSETYHELLESNCYNALMLDGALLLLRYRFRSGSISEHSLSYLPSPSLLHFQNEPEIYLEDAVYAEVTSKRVVPFPVRFDFNSDPDRHVPVHHPLSHLTLGQYANCRVPVTSPVSPMKFGWFVLQCFYNTAFRKYADSLPRTPLAFSETISDAERLISHFVM